MKRPTEDDEELHGRAGLQGLVLQELMAAMDDYSVGKHPKMKKPPVQAKPDEEMGGGVELGGMDPRLAEIIKRKKKGAYC